MVRKAIHRVMVAAVVSLGALGSCARVQELLNYSPSGIGKLKDMTAKKMGSTGKDLHDFLLKMVLDA